MASSSLAAYDLSRPERLTPARRSAVRALRVQASAGSRTADLRKLLSGPQILKVSFMSGFCVSAARSASPDAGLLSYAEMLDTGRLIHESTSSMPIIGDGDTGYGNAMNVKRTVNGYAAAGFAGILIEDQEWPKRCGHMGVKRVVSRHEAVARVRAAADARDEGADILILARTDARQAISLEEALWRAAAFADAGADMLFIDALTSVEDMQAFCRAGGSVASKPKMANMLEGGRTPLLPADQLQDMGFSIVAYPLSLLGTYVQGMQKTLQLLKQGGPESFPPSTLPSFETLQAAVRFPEYLAGAEKYAKLEQGLADAFSRPDTSSSTSNGTAASSSHPAADPHSEASAAGPVESPTASTGGLESNGQESAAHLADSNVVQQAHAASNAESKVVEADAIITDSSTSTEIPQVMDSSSASGAPARKQDMRWQDPDFRRSKTLRFRVTDRLTGTVKLETTFPAGFLDSIPAFLPALAGIDLKQALSSAQPDQLGDQAVADFTNDGDRVQIFLL